MSYTLKNEWRTSVLVTAMAVIAPLSWAGGGGVDNDSPFGAPKSSSEDDEDPPSSFVSSDDCVGLSGISVAIGAGSSLQFGSITTMSSQIDLAANAMMQGDPDHPYLSHGAGGFEDLEVTADILVPDGEDVFAVSTGDGYSAQGRLIVHGDVQVVLRASSKAAHGIAFLVIGEEVSGPEGSTFQAEHIIQLALVNNGVDITGLRDALAPHAAVLEGKVAKVHLVGFRFDLSAGWMISYEGSARFEIAPDAAIELDTAP